MITFRCKNALFERLVHFARQRQLDRTSVLKLALHYYLNRLSCQISNQRN
jgi:predicted transcriptional regulator